MLFLALLKPISNIARPEICLWGVFGQRCEFVPSEITAAYFGRLKHIKACNHQYVKGCRAWPDNYQSEPKLYSRDNNGIIAILK